MGLKENCKDCTYRVVGAHNIIICLVLGTVVSSKRCGLKEIGDPIVGRIGKLESK